MSLQKYWIWLLWLWFQKKTKATNSSFYKKPKKHEEGKPEVEALNNVFKDFERFQESRKYDVVKSVID